MINRWGYLSSVKRRGTRQRTCGYGEWSLLIESEAGCNVRLFFYHFLSHFPTPRDVAFFQLAMLINYVIYVLCDRTVLRYINYKTNLYVEDGLTNVAERRKYNIIIDKNKT